MWRESGMENREWRESGYGTGWLCIRVWIVTQRVMRFCFTTLVSGITLLGLVLNCSVTVRAACPLWSLRDFWDVQLEFFVSLKLSSNCNYWINRLFHISHFTYEYITLLLHWSSCCLFDDHGTLEICYWYYWLHCTTVIMYLCIYLPNPWLTQSPTQISQLS